MSTASKSMSPSTSTIRLSSSQISIVSASSADSCDSTEQTIFPSPGRGKMVSVCKNCSYSFRRKSDFDSTEFCCKDCQTCHILKPPESPHNPRFPSPVPFHPNNGQERPPERPMTAKEIKESIFKFQQEMDCEDAEIEAAAQRSQPVSPRGGGPPLSRQTSERLTIRNPTPPPPFPTGFDSPVVGVATAGGGTTMGGGRKKAFLPPTDSSFDPRARPPLSPLIILKKQDSFSFLSSLRSGSSSPHNNINAEAALSSSTNGQTLLDSDDSPRGRNSPSPSLRRGEDSNGSIVRAVSPLRPGVRLLNWTKRMMSPGRRGGGSDEMVPESALEYLSTQQQKEQ